MPHKPLSLLILLAGLFLFAGCGAQGGRTIYTQGANADPVMGTAPQDGLYQLYTAMSPNPTTTVKLKQGARLGFNRAAGGQIEAVAGEQSVVLPKGTAQAYWKLQEK